MLQLHFSLICTTVSNLYVPLHRNASLIRRWPRLCSSVCYINTFFILLDPAVSPRGFYQLYSQHEEVIDSSRRERGWVRGGCCTCRGGEGKGAPLVWSRSVYQKKPGHLSALRKRSEQRNARHSSLPKGGRLGDLGGTNSWQSVGLKGWMWHYCSVSLGEPVMVSQQERVLKINGLVEEKVKYLP